MTEKIGLLAAFGPELDGVGQGVDRLAVAADKRAAKVYMLEVVFFRLKIGDLTDVVSERGFVSKNMRGKRSGTDSRDSIEQTPADVFGCKHSPFADLVL